MGRSAPTGDASATARYRSSDAGRFDRSRKGRRKQRHELLGGDVATGEPVEARSLEEPDPAPKGDPQRRGWLVEVQAVGDPGDRLGMRALDDLPDLRVATDPALQDRAVG